MGSRDFGLRHCKGVQTESRAQDIDAGSTQSTVWDAVNLR